MDKLKFTIVATEPATQEEKYDYLDHIAIEMYRGRMIFCPKCGDKLPPECQGHDPCVKDLDVPPLHDETGVGDVCCGHGLEACAYVCIKSYPNPEYLRGKDALEFFKSQGKGPEK